MNDPMSQCRNQCDMHKTTISLLKVSHRQKRGQRDERVVVQHQHQHIIISSSPPPPRLPSPEAPVGKSTLHTPSQNPLSSSSPGIDFQPNLNCPQNRPHALTDLHENPQWQLQQQQRRSSPTTSHVSLFFEMSERASLLPPSLNQASKQEPTPISPDRLHTYYDSRPLFFIHS